MDRRVKHTKMALNHSLVNFLKEKELNRITVKELCLDADVNRSTYYAHFTDPYDQLSKLKAELLLELTDYTNELDLNHLDQTERIYQLMKKVLQYMEVKKDFFRILLSKNPDRDQQLDILNFLTEKALPEDVTYKFHQEELSYLKIYIATGCFGMFYNWLMSDTPIATDRLARLMADFTSGVLS